MSNQERIIEAIKEIYEKYEQNPFMEQKVTNYVCSQLPLIFENIERTHNERSQRIDELTAEQDSFIQHFLYTIGISIIHPQRRFSTITATIIVNMERTISSSMCSQPLVVMPI